MELTSSMPHKCFEVLVKFHRQNGVRLIEGKHDHEAGKYFTCYIFSLTNPFAYMFFYFKYYIQKQKPKKLSWNESENYIIYNIILS